VLSPRADIGGLAKLSRGQECVNRRTGGIYKISHSAPVGAVKANGPAKADPLDH